MDIPHGTWITVADGAKWLIFRNEGDGEFPKLELIDHASQPDLAGRDMGSDRPGRAHQHGVPGRSAVEETDFHQQSEDRFAKELAGYLYRKAHAGAYEALILVAAPKVLGVIRQALHGAVTQRQIGELAKDLVKHPVREIERILLSA